MNQTLLLIRHGMTQGNFERRYIGRTDEPLCAEGLVAARALLMRGLLPVTRVFSSPMLRCVQTADILFPQQRAVLVPALKECNFGQFEGCTADELAAYPAYAAWVASGCAAPIPGGEDPGQFKARCCEAFVRLAADLQDGACAAIVTHGGCIMSILERFAVPRRPFYDWHVENCVCITGRFDGSRLLLAKEGPC